jgi:hypothetical protein
MLCRGPWHAEMKQKMAVLDDMNAHGHRGIKHVDHYSGLQSERLTRL